MIVPRGSRRMAPVEFPMQSFVLSPNGVKLMLRIAILFVAILPTAVTVSAVEASYCVQSFDLDAVRNRWAVARQSRVDAAHYDESCRAYGNQFFEAVTARHAGAVPLSLLRGELTVNIGGPSGVHFGLS
jgi:hypothetical protein